MIEQLLLTDPKIAKVVVFGSGQFLNGVLLSPSQHPVNSSKFLDDIWSTISHANGIIPTHSRLFRELVLVESPAKSFAMSDKGTIKSAQTIALYSNEIEDAYSNLLVSGGRVEDLQDVENTPASLRSYLMEVLRQGGVDVVSDDDNLFDHGT